MKNVSIDSDVMISSQIKEESNHKESKIFMDKVLSKKYKDMTFFTSIFTLLELASAMKRRTQDEDKAYSLIYRVTKSWRSIINPLPLLVSKKQMSSAKFSTELIDELLETAIKFNTTSGDTVHAQSVVENEIDFFVTWNKKDFMKMESKIDGLRVLTPSEFTLNAEVMVEEEKMPKSMYEKIKIISTNSGLSELEVKDRIIRKKLKFSGLISFEGAGQIVAADLKV